MHILDKWCQARVNLDNAKQDFKKVQKRFWIGILLFSISILGGALVSHWLFILLPIAIALIKLADLDYTLFADNAEACAEEYKDIEREFYSTWLDDDYTFNA